jgi:hypothetical protein
VSESETNGAPDAAPELLRGSPGLEFGSVSDVATLTLPGAGGTPVGADVEIPAVGVELTPGAVGGVESVVVTPGELTAAGAGLDASGVQPRRFRVETAQNTRTGRRTRMDAPANPDDLGARRKATRAYA